MSREGKCPCWELGGAGGEDGGCDVGMGKEAEPGGVPGADGGSHVLGGREKGRGRRAASSLALSSQRFLP